MCAYANICCQSNLLFGCTIINTVAIIGAAYNPGCEKTIITNDDFSTSLMHEKNATFTGASLSNGKYAGAAAHL